MNYPIHAFYSWLKPFINIEYNVILSGVYEICFKNVPIDAIYVSHLILPSSIINIDLFNHLQIG